MGSFNKKRQFKIATIRAGVRKTESTENTDRRIEKTKGAGQVCGASGQAFSVPKMQAMLLRFGEIAESRGDPVPTVWSLLTDSEPDKAERMASPEKVRSMLEDVQSKLNNTEATEREKLRERGEKKKAAKKTVRRSLRFIRIL